MGRSLCLCALVLLAAVASGCGGASGPAEDDGIEAPAPQPGVDVRAVRAVIDLDPETLRLDGVATLDVAVPDTLTRLALGFDDAMDISTVLVDGVGALFWRDGDGLYVPLGDMDTTASVEVTYTGTPSAGVYADEAAGQRVVYTDGWPDRTAGWLPTVHHPSDPSRLDLTLVVPAALEVVASGAAVSDSVASGRRYAR
ncbi:MAG: hypothetical protein AAGK21_15485, partial [Bacteroidota bacterium]